MRVAVRMRTEYSEAYSFHPLVAILVALLAIVFQGYLPLWFPRFAALDLTLLVTVYFAISRRSQVWGLFTGAAIGLAQDSLSHGPIGLFGMVKTIIGYAASSLGFRVDTDHPGIRLLVVFGFYYIHALLLTLLQRVLLERAVPWPGSRSIALALLNALLGVLLFRFLDRFKRSS